MPVNLRGFSSLLPEKVTVQYRTRCCSGVTSPPNDYQVSVTPRDVDFAAYKPHIGAVLVHDSAYAIFNGGDTPINADRLKTLSQNIARDLFEWRSNQGDKVYAGIVAPEMTALDDCIEWQMDDTSCSTTQSSGPYIQEADRLLHHDPTGFCKVPCDAELIYGGTMSIVGDKVRVPIYAAYLDDDKVPPEIKFDLQAYTNLRACCGDSPNVSGCLSCSVPIPKAWNYVFDQWVPGSYLAPPQSGYVNIGQTAGSFQYQEVNDLQYFKSIQDQASKKYSVFSFGPGWHTELSYKDIVYNFNPDTNEVTSSIETIGPTTGVDIVVYRKYIWLCNRAVMNDLFRFGKLPEVTGSLIELRTTNFNGDITGPYVYDVFDDFPRYNLAGSAAPPMGVTSKTCSPFFIQTSSVVGIQTNPFKVISNTFTITK